MTKASLIKLVKALQRENDEILSFHALPLKTVNWRRIEVVRATLGFIPLCQYAHHYCLHPGEVGYLKGVRYRMDE